MKTLVLSPADRRRLEKLAKAAGRTPAQTLRFVLRDGFDFCEWEVREIRKAEARARRDGTVPDEAVQRDARAIVAGTHGRREKQAA